MKNEMRTGRKRREITAIVLRYVMIFVFMLPMILPVLWMLSTALKDNAGVFATPPQFIPKVFQWGNFKEAVIQSKYLQRFGNTLFIAVLCIIGSILSNFMVGYALARFKFKGRKMWFYLIISSMMIPGMTTVMPVFRFWVAVGAYGTWLPLILPAWLAGPFNTFLCKQFLSTIPRSYDEAAKIDGATYFQILSRIIMPLSKPLIAYMAVSTFQGSWNDYMNPLLYVISKQDKWTLALGIARLGSGTFGIEWNVYMAADILYFLPILVVFFIFQDYFMEGLGSMTAAGVK